MRGISVDQSVIDQILTGKAPAKVEEKTETKPVEKAAPTKVEESTEDEGETHVCPLCESALENPLSEEKIEEHVNWMLGVINENFEIDADSLDEEVEEDSEDEAEDK